MVDPPVAIPQQGSHYVRSGDLLERVSAADGSRSRVAVVGGPPIDTPEPEPPQKRQYRRRAVA